MTSMAFTTGYQFVKLVVEPPANKLPDNDNMGHVVLYELAAPMNWSLQRDRNFEVFGSSAGSLAQLVIPFWLISPIVPCVASLGMSEQDLQRMYLIQCDALLVKINFASARWLSWTLRSISCHALDQGALKFCFVFLLQRSVEYPCVSAVALRFKTSTFSA